MEQRLSFPSSADLPNGATLTLQVLDLDRLDYHPRYRSLKAEVPKADDAYYDKLMYAIADSRTDVAPLIVVESGGRMLIEDGNTRAEIATLLGLTRFPAYVYRPL